jgi:hypothetical protein
MFNIVHVAHAHIRIDFLLLFIECLDFENLSILSLFKIMLWIWTFNLLYYKIVKCNIISSTQFNKFVFFCSNDGVQSWSFVWIVWKFVGYRILVIFPCECLYINIHVEWQKNLVIVEDIESLHIWYLLLFAMLLEIC